MEMQKEIDCASKKTVSLKEIGQLLRGARKKEGLTQKQLAEELMVNKMAISHVENGLDRASKVLLNRMAKRLKVTFDLTFPYDED